MKCIKPRTGTNYHIFVEANEDQVTFINSDGRKLSLEMARFILEDEEVKFFEIPEDQLSELQIRNYNIWLKSTEEVPSTMYSTSHNQFYVHRTEFDEFMRDVTKTDFKINASGSPNHPPGYYIIPKLVLQRLVQSWVDAGDIDWINNGKHSSSTVPTYLQEYWHRNPR